jgi:electron transport complex protein RnfE
MKGCVERLYNGVIKENPTFVLMLGMCPTLAVTSSAFNGFGMGMTTMVVLALSNLVISCMRNIIPDRVRIPAFIVIVASLVTIVQLLLQAYIPVLNDLLGIYIPLIVVNCIILGRAEAYASKNKPLLSLFDGIGMGLGFTLGLTLIGIFRELLGSGSIFGLEIIPERFHISIFVMAPGAFFVLAMLTALQNKLKAPSATNREEESALACGGNCAGCAGNACAANHALLQQSADEKKGGRT